LFQQFEQRTIPCTLLDSNRQGVLSMYIIALQDDKLHWSPGSAIISLTMYTTWMNQF